MQQRLEGSSDAKRERKERKAKIQEMQNREGEVEIGIVKMVYGRPLEICR